MPITATCEACASKFKVADQFAGKKGKCKKCGGIVRIPAAVAAPAPESDLYDLAEPERLEATAAAVAPIAPIAAPRVAPIQQPAAAQRPVPGSWGAASQAPAKQSDPTWLLRILKIIGGVICLVGGLALAGLSFMAFMDDESTVRRPIKGIGAGIFLIILGGGLIIKGITNSDD